MLSSFIYIFIFPSYKRAVATKMAKLISCGANQISLEQLLRLIVSPGSNQAASTNYYHHLAAQSEHWWPESLFHLDGPLRLHLSRRRSGWKLEITRISAFKGCVA
jgi:hypothetical protein